MPPALSNSFPTSAWKKLRMNQNGKLVLGESIGDLGGLKIAWLAFQKALQGKPRPADIDGFTPRTAVLPWLGAGVG